MLPGSFHQVVRHDLQLGGNLDQVALRVLDHEEKIVAWAVSSRSPPQLYAQRRQVVRPIADVVPARNLIGVMVRPRLRTAECGETVVFRIGAEKASRWLHSRAIFEDIIRN